MITQEQKQQLWTLIEPIGTAMLASWNGEYLHARPMVHVNDTFEGELLFYTHMDSAKVDEISNYDDVCLSYMDTDKQCYVSLSGAAMFTQDKKLIDKHWNAFVAAWFPEGKDSRDIGLLRVHVYKAEIWDSPSSSMVQLFHIAKANMTNTKPDMGEHEKFG